MATINQNDFNCCPNNIQLILCKYNGTFLVRRLEYSYIVELHFIGTYYVEIWLNKKSQQPLYSKTFVDHANLYPFLEFIDISQLVGE